MTGILAHEPGSKFYYSLIESGKRKGEKVGYIVNHMLSGKCRRIDPHDRFN